MISTSSIGTPSNYIGTRKPKKFSEYLKAIKDPKRKRLQPILIYNAKELGGVGRYDPKFL
jgi:hypothetical protein